MYCVPWIFLVETFALMNCDLKLGVRKATMATRERFRRHSSQQTATFAKPPATLKFGEATTLPITLYHHWLHAKERTSFVEDKVTVQPTQSPLVQVFGGNIYIYICMSIQFHSEKGKKKSLVIIRQIGSLLMPLQCTQHHIVKCRFIDNIKFLFFS